MILSTFSFIICFPLCNFSPCSSLNFTYSNIVWLWAMSLTEHHVKPRCSETSECTAANLAWTEVFVPGCPCGGQEIIKNVVSNSAPFSYPVKLTWKGWLVEARGWLWKTDLLSPAGVRAWMPEAGREGLASPFMVWLEAVTQHASPQLPEVWRRHHCPAKQIVPRVDASNLLAFLERMQLYLSYSKIMCVNCPNWKIYLRSQLN